MNKTIIASVLSLGLLSSSAMADYFSCGISFSLPGVKVKYYENKTDYEADLDWIIKLTTMECNDSWNKAQYDLDCSLIKCARKSDVFPNKTIEIVYDASKQGEE